MAEVHQWSTYQCLRTAKMWAPDVFPATVHPDTPRKWSKMKGVEGGRRSPAKKVDPAMVQKLATMTLSLLKQPCCLSGLCVALFNKPLGKEGMDVHVQREWVRTFFLDMGLSDKRRTSSGLHQHTEMQKLHFQRRLKLKIAWCSLDTS
eukprot:3783761-Amphidinium_carterae.1